ncbi:hypothetical protein GNP73_17405 [Aliivibrio fischeri]|uniref:hypothetical protein n=1 Tax=Aliivibrio fischeri TaxID=668 RepID=UPI0012DAB85F|nr:hypothetical protein [Aliivibrio fischeri]MUJ29745.1 hypothetical protein [Aliivibrio fischeri]
MEIIEKKFRDTTIANKKYVKRLTDYIYFLMDKERVVESKYYFDKLIALKPLHIKTNVLGYKLAIKTFDNESVVKFDKLLCKQRYNEELLLTLQLQYYYSVNSKHNFSKVACFLLNKKSLTEKTFSDIGLLILSQDCYEPIAGLCKYLHKNNKSLHKTAESRVRKTVLHKLITVLRAK